MSTADPWRTFALEPAPARSSDEELVFTFTASCELVFTPDEMEDGRSIILPETRKTLYFSKSASGEMNLDEKKSGLTVREFRILTDPQLTIGAEFWEVYGDDLERIAMRSGAESVHAWIEANNSEGWAIPEKIKIAIGRLR